MALRTSVYYKNNIYSLANRTKHMYLNTYASYAGRIKKVSLGIFLMHKFIFELVFYTLNAHIDCNLVDWFKKRFSEN